MPTEEITHQLDVFLNELHQQAENKREILVNDAELTLTNTQGHILMLLAECGAQTNAQLAKLLHVSPAAMTKAMKGLTNREEQVVTAVADTQDARMNRWSLTEAGQRVAKKHEKAHQLTRAAYQEVLDNFSEEEQAVIARFISLLSACSLREE